MALRIKKDIDLDILVTKYNFTKLSTGYYDAPSKKDEYGDRMASIGVDAQYRRIDVPLESYYDIDIDPLFDLIVDGLVEKVEKI